MSYHSSVLIYNQQNIGQWQYYNYECFLSVINPGNVTLIVGPTP